MRDVRDVHVRPILLQRQGIVEVLRRLRVDRERQLAPQIDAPFDRRLGNRVRLELDARAGLDQQRLEHVLDPLRRSDDALHARAALAPGHDGEVARSRLPRPLAVDDHRHAGREVRLADEQLPAPGELDDDGLV